MLPKKTAKDGKFLGCSVVGALFYCSHVVHKWLHANFMLECLNPLILLALRGKYYCNINIPVD